MKPTSETANHRGAKGGRKMNIAKEQTGLTTPPEVPAKATRSGSSREQEWGTLRLSHDSTRGWTERMLEALGRGNEGRQWHTLIAKVFSLMGAHHLSHMRDYPEIPRMARSKSCGRGQAERAISGSTKPWRVDATR